MRYIDDLVLSEASSTCYYYCQDANWNVVAALNTSGAVQERYAYTPYGVVEYLTSSFGSSSSSSIANEFLYTGRRLDPETGLYQYRNRYYGAELGRFLTRDPIGYEGSAYNLYEYVNGIPTIATDPYGQITVRTVNKRLNVPCGDIASVLWDFVLDKPAPCDGYIVQKVELRCTIDESCCFCPDTSPTVPDATFWEAWPVAAGARVHNARQEMNPPPTDVAAQRVFNDTCGNVSAVGTIKFFCKDKNHPAANGVGTGNLGKIGRIDPLALWLPDVRSLEGKCQVTTGFLPGTRVEPDWWNAKSVDPTASRSFSVYWNCFPWLEDFVSAHANPN